MKLLLKLRRVERGMKQKTLSELTGIPQVKLSTYECRDVNPTIDTLCKIAKALGVGVDDLIDKCDDTSKTA